MNSYVYRAFSLNMVVSFLSNHQYMSPYEFQLVSVGYNHNDNCYLVTYAANQEFFY